MVLENDLSGVLFNNGLQIAVKQISKKHSIEKEEVEFVLDRAFAENYRKGLVKSDIFLRKVKKALEFKKYK